MEKQMTQTKNTRNPEPARPGEEAPFIPYLDEADFDQRLQPVLAPYKDRMGFLPNALRLYAYRPEIAQTLWALNSNIMRDPTSTLDQFLKRRLAAVCCAINGCGYCTAHSCAMLKKDASAASEGWGMSDDDVEALVSDSLVPKDEFERACFDYVRLASSDPTDMPDEIFDRLKTHLTPPQIVELACVVGFWKFYNTVHDSLRIPIEAALQEDARYVDHAVSGR
jgi:alkylhydroperoxidase family enzyme